MQKRYHIFNLLITGRHSELPMDIGKQFIKFPTSQNDLPISTGREFPADSDIFRHRYADKSACTALMLAQRLLIFVQVVLPLPPVFIPSWGATRRGCVN
jgi:hypothetical protein